MEFSKYDLFAYQIMEYLISEQNYQVVRVLQHKDDIWLINPQAESFPVIRIASTHGVALNLDYLRNVHLSLLQMIHREARLVVFQTDPQAEPIHNEDIIEVYCEPHKISNPLVLTAFQQLPHILQDSSDIGGDIARIMCSIEEAQQKNYAKIIEKVKQRAHPKVTLCVLSVCMVLGLVSILIQSLCSNTTVAFIVSGAFYKMNILAAHEYWRLITSAFVVDNLWILLFQGVAFYYIAKSCEPYYQKKHFLGIMLGSLLLGNLFLLVVGSQTLSFGIAPIVFGLTGAFFVRCIVQHLYYSVLISIQWIRNCLFLVLFFFLPHTSYFAMLGGFLGGMIIAVLLIKKESMKNIQKHTKLASILMITALLYLGIFHNPMLVFDQESDQALISTLRQTPLNFYADYLETCYNDAYE